MHLICIPTLIVGSVTQWLGRRSLAGGLSLIYMGKVSAVGQPTMANLALHPPGSVNE